MKKIYISIVLLLLCAFSNNSHSAVQTSSSFDINYALAGLTISGQKTDDSARLYDRSMFSLSGFELNYNVALYDYSTVAFISFYQLMSSSMNTPMPLGRIALGAVYHPFRMNGQRIVLDNQVEGKSWGISTAIELSVGITRLSIEDPELAQTQFTTALIDLLPRLLFEIPITPRFLLILRGGYFVPFIYKNKEASFQVYYQGYTFSVGGKLASF